MATLIFVDTNILLDFYRVRGRQGDLSILDHIDENHGRIITTSQVEMEFKKNRPFALLESYNQLKKPDWKNLSLPAYLARSKQSSGLETGRKRIESQLTTLRERLERGFRDPTRNDPVYKVAQRLFRHAGPYNLTRENEHRKRIRRAAWRRFILGYPPRKPRDTSIGDAINWEWVVHCAIESGDDVVIVSRDSDYGIRFGKEVYLNDWLIEEFRDRVSRRRSLTLTERLADAFKLAEIEVTAEEEAAEEALLEQRTKGYPHFQLPEETLIKLAALQTQMANLGMHFRPIGEAFRVDMPDIEGLFGRIQMEGDDEEPEQQRPGDDGANDEEG